VAAQKIYWTDNGSNKIQRANMDGSSIEDLVTTGIDFVRGMALDLSGGKIYWADAGTDKIQRANLDGSNIEDVVATGLGSPFDVVLEPPPPQPVPAVSSWGVLALGILMLTAGSIVVVRQERPKAT
jgi:hypothetical protein